MHPENRLTHNWLIKKVVNDLVRAYLPECTGTVVDLGCGTRPYERDILRYANEYIGIDWGNSPHGIHADIVADLNAPIPLADAVADAVVCFEVLEHVAESETLLAESARILCPCGTLLLSVPFQWWVHEEPWDFRRYTSHGLKYVLSKAGYDDIRIVPTTGFWSMWVLKLNYQLVKLARGPRPVRWLVRAALIPLWWTGQKLAPIMDRLCPEDRETAGYFVVAHKRR